MSFRYPVPNEQQAQRLRDNGMDPTAYVVRSADEDGTLHLQCHKTGDEIRLAPNPLKKRRKANGYQ